MVHGLTFHIPAHRDRSQSRLGEFLDMRRELIPVLSLFVCDFSEHGFQVVIKPLYEAVGLRMVGCGSYGLYL